MTWISSQAQNDELKKVNRRPCRHSELDSESMFNIMTWIPGQAQNDD